jgi:NADH-quinone oxidoreductase subunit L
VGEELAHPVWVSFALHGLISPPFWLAVAGAVTAWLFFLRNPAWADRAAHSWRWLYRLLVQKYYFDWFNDKVITPLTRGIGLGLWRGGDEVLIDGAMVNGTAEGVSRFGGLLRLVQTGYLYSYAFWMMIGLALLLGWFLMHFFHGR